MTSVDELHLSILFNGLVDNSNVLEKVQNNLDVLKEELDVHHNCCRLLHLPAEILKPFEVENLRLDPSRLTS
jgi:hypothetical protein